MPIVAPTPTANNAPVPGALPPWHDDHPEQLALERSIPHDHLARCIAQAVDRLDLQPLCDCYAGTGSAPYPPALLLRAVLFQTRRGQHSPATWYRDAHACLPVRWLLRGCTPSRSCWYAFRDRLAPVLATLNAQPLHAAVAQGLTPATRAAADGTFAAANASRHRLLNEATLDKRLEQLAQACAADAAGVAAPVPGWMAKTAGGRSRQQRRLRQARQQLQAAQTRNARKRASKRKPRSQVRISPGDPEAALGLDKEDVYRPLYNVQLVDDLDSPFLLGYEVFAQPNDAGLLGSMLARVRALVGHPLEALLADTAYVGGADLKAAADAHVTVYGPLPAAAAGPTKQLPKSAFRWEAATQSYVCPQGHRLEAAGSSKQQRSGVETVVLHCYRCPPEHCSACPLRAHCTRNPQAGRTVSRSEHEELIEALRLRMETPEAKALYKLRRQTVELVNADWKEHRKLRRCSGRGLARARCQAGLVVLAHNLLTLLQEEKKAQTAAAAAANPREIATYRPLRKGG